MSSSSLVGLASSFSLARHPRYRSALDFFFSVSDVFSLLSFLRLSLLALLLRRLALFIMQCISSAVYTNYFARSVTARNKRESGANIDTTRKQFEQRSRASRKEEM